jgi:sRNA-binding protein
MAKARKAQKALPGVDLLLDALARTTELATSLTTESIDSVFRVLGVVSEQDLEDIRRTMARLERRLARVEERRHARKSRERAQAAGNRTAQHAHADRG